MLRVKINTYEKGLVYQDQKLVEVLEPGKYWMFGSKQVIRISTLSRFMPKDDLSLLLKNTALAAQLDVLEITDEQVALVFKNGIFQNIHPEGKYAYWKTPIEYTFKILDMTALRVESGLSKKVMNHLVSIGLVKAVEVKNYETGMLQVDGEFLEQLKPGLHYFYAQLRTVKEDIIDNRQQSLEMSGQEILTKDKANLRINFEAAYKVVDATVAILQNLDYKKQLYTIIQMTIREYVGGFTFDELLSQKTEVGKAITELSQERCAELGVELMSCGIKDIILPGDIKEIMNQVLVAEKQAAASMIMRREETASTRSMLNTAKLMENNQMLYKLKEMEFVEKVADKIGEITVSGNGNMVGQLKEILGSSA